MERSYDDRDGFIWLDEEIIPWRKAQVHILTHALHYASSVFEGERAYNGKIFKSKNHSSRLIESGKMLDMPIPYSLEEIEAAKYEILKISGLSDAYVRVICWRGSGTDMGVASAANPVRMAIAVWKWGAYYGDAKMKGAKLDISKWKRPSPETIPCHAKASGLYMICTMSKHDAEAKGCSDSMMYDHRGYVAEATGANIFFVKDNEVHFIILNKKDISASGFSYVSTMVVHHGVRTTFCFCVVFRHGTDHIKTRSFGMTWNCLWRRAFPF